MIRRVKKGAAVVLCLVIFFSMTVMNMPAVNTAAAKKPGITKKLTLTEGKTGKIRVKRKYINSIKYKSSDKKTATVTKSGKVKAKKAGICRVYVTVKYRKKKASKNFLIQKSTCKVIVKKKKTVAPPYQPSDEFTEQAANFAVKLLQNTSGEEVAKGENVLISPESIICALAMTANGASWNTLTEFEKVLCGSINRDVYNNTLHTLNTNLMAAKNVKFNLANSIWLKKENFNVWPGFIQKNQSLFDAEVRQVSFNNDTLKEINGWVKECTDGMIEKVMDKLNPNIVALLVNALTFEGRWADIYREYNVKKNQTFTDAGGRKDKATMLYGTEHTYMEDDKAAGFVKYYQGYDFAFVALRPNNGVSAGDYLQNLTGEKFLKLYQAGKKADGIVVNTKMPEFSYDYNASLKPALTSMGIKDAFLAQKADFSNMGELPGEKIVLTDVIHKTYIELNRYGTKAAAVTMPQVSGSAMPREIKEVYLDKPFLYAIVEAKTGFPIFMGVMNDLA